MTDILWPFCRLTLLITFLWMILVFLILIENGHTAEVFTPTHNNCAIHISQYEKQHAIPTGLLHAISKAESGRKDDTGRIVAWPWTMNVQGQGSFFPTKQAAIAAVQAMQAKGIQSIDVGCMQVNLYYHPRAFRTLEDAFEPSKNVAYAAHFLKTLKNDHRSWQRAIAYYHSANPRHHIPYQKTVLGIWDRDSKRGGFSLAAGIFTQHSSSFKMNHIRRLTRGKVLKLTTERSSLASSKTSARRPMGRVNASHIRRLHLSAKR